MTLSYLELAADIYHGNAAEFQVKVTFGLDQATTKPS